MTNAPAVSYDEIPYGDYAFAATHPDRLAAVATLYGLAPPAVADCRVLEIGCAVGGNLLPMALTLPNGRFLGIDISPGQVAVGQERIRALGLANVELRTQDILEFPADAGEFDYIICHGVYSWVPRPVQERIMNVCRTHLAANGIAYISYNALPGWHIRGLVRDMLNVHARRFADSRTRLDQTRAFLEFLSNTFGQWDTLYANLLNAELKELLATSDDYLYHEHLEEFNEPLYFSEFIERAAAHCLQYVAEADNLPSEQRLGEDVHRQLFEMTPDRVHFEQYRDFFVARMFRKTLLCREGLAVSEFPRKEPLQSLRIAGLLQPARTDADEGDVTSDDPLEFRNADGATVTTNHPFSKAALLALAQAAPASVAFEELWRQVASMLQERTGRTYPPKARAELAAMLLKCHTGGMVELHAFEPPFTTEAPIRPCASPVARAQAARDDASKVTNLRHRGVELPAFERVLLGLLDGTRNEAALLKTLAALVNRDELQIESDGRPVADRSQLSSALHTSLKESLQRFAKNALLLRSP